MHNHFQGNPKFEKFRSMILYKILFQPTCVCAVVVVVKKRTPTEYNCSRSTHVICDIIDNNASYICYICYINIHIYTSMLCKRYRIQDTGILYKYLFICVYLKNVSIQSYILYLISYMCRRLMSHILFLPDGAGAVSILNTMPAALKLYRTPSATNISSMLQFLPATVTVASLT